MADILLDTQGEPAAPSAGQVGEGPLLLRPGDSHNSRATGVLRAVSSITVTTPLQAVEGW